ncbi:alpha-amylase family protein [Verrucomicrobiota bacterium]
MLQPKRFRRADSFLGIHFDFHAGHDCKEIGRNVSRRMVENIVELVRPDYIQCDCKGHPGVASYPTKVGTAAPGFARDQLRIWRDVTAEHGVALFMHYSGVWDSEVVKRHPSWARINEEGKRDPNATSVFGPYVDKLLIPQMKELCDGYGVDGVWVDGECWGTGRDYGKKVLAAFRKTTGIRSIPRKLGDKGFHQFNEFCREAFREYLRHYCNALHEHDPDFQIASNWAFTSFMPEPVCAPVDYLSGDYSLQDSVNAARFEARCVMGQGMPWDLMAWSFSSRWKDPCRSTKTAIQLKQEAAVVLALGGGFQAYFKQKRDGSIYDWTMDIMAEVAKFCRARQAICHKAEPVPQIALLFSNAALYREGSRLFGTWGELQEPTMGVLNALLDGQNSVEIVSEHHLAGRMKRWPVIVIPEWGYLKPSFKKELVEYVKEGGRLLCVGPGPVRMFAKELGVKLQGKVVADRGQWLKHGDHMAGARSDFQEAKKTRGVEVLGKLYREDDDRKPGDVAATIRKLGKGQIAGVYFNVGNTYRKRNVVLLRDFLGDLVRKLYPRPIVTVEGSHCVDVSVMKKNGKLCVNLLNTAGPHADENVYAFDQIPPVGPLDIAIRARKRPKAVRRYPGGKRLKFSWSKGVVKVKLARLAIHEVVVVSSG